MMITVKELIESNAGADNSTKKALIESWCESYLLSEGKKPNSYELVMLADWLLEKELKDSSRSKVQKKEYPILSKPQLERRYREVSMNQEIVDVLHQKRIHNIPTRKKDSKNNDY
jgi:hypothetical protein